jgi:hypothetical protein
VRQEEKQRKTNESVVQVEGKKRRKYRLSNKVNTIEKGNTKEEVVGIIQTRLPARNKGINKEDVILSPDNESH